MLRRRISHLVKRYYSNYIIKSPFNEVVIPEITVDHLIWSNLSKWENKTAVECGITGRKMTYKEVYKRSKSLASSLRTLSLSGSTALLVLPNCPEYPVAVLAAIQAGMTVSGVNHLYTSGEIKHQAKDAGAKVVITAPDCLETVRAANLGLPIICTGNQQADGIHSLNQMSECEVNSSHKLEGCLSQLAFLPYSSGTTGLPKGVRLSHRNVVANIEQTRVPEVCPIHEAIGDHQDTLPAILPFFHSYGLVVVMLRGLVLGAKIVTLPKFEPATFLEVIKKNKNVILHAVPPIINFLGSSSDVKGEDLKGLTHTLCGAAPCSSNDLERYCKKKMHSVTQAYGMTEASPVLTHPHIENNDRATVGPPVSNTECRIIDSIDGKPLPPGLHGELCFKGPQVMEGYHNRPDATAVTLDEEGWLHTGDIGYADKNGNIYIVDRLKELIKVKGFQVAPAELESLLRQHPTVLDVGVTSVPSAKHGELPIAFVVPKPGQTFNTDVILQWIEKQVAPYKKPAKIIATMEIPKSASGKILRRKLKEIAKDMPLD